MIKHICILFILLIAFSSCGFNNEWADVPYGVWASESPNLIIYIYEAYTSLLFPHMYLGFYYINDEMNRIYVSFNDRFGRLHIGMPSSIIMEDGRVIATRGDALHQWYAGWVTVRGDRLYLSLLPFFQERTGLDQIIFHRLHEYPAINPDDWFQLE